MTTLLEPSHPFWIWLTRVSWQASVFVLLVLAVQWLFRKQLAPRGRCLLWWLVVIRLALPVSPPSRVSIFNCVGWRAESLPRDVAAPARESEPVIPSATLIAAELGRPMNSISPEASPQLESRKTTGNPRSAGTTPTLGTRQGRFALPWRRALVWLWFAGVGSLAGHLGWSLLCLRRELRHAIPVADTSVLRLLDRCREEMAVRGRLSLVETSAVASPALYGLFSPRLLLPPGLIGNFTESELRFVFLHELAHLKRGDIAANWLATLVQLLHWFNPLIWLAFARMRADRELACDAVALAHAPADQSQAYGQTIIKLLEGFARPSPLPGLVGILEDRNQMRRRIGMIAAHSHGRRSPPLLLILVCSALTAFALTDAHTRKAESSEEADSRRAIMAPPSQSARTNANPTILSIQGEAITAISRPGSKEWDRVEVRSNVVVEAGDLRLTADRMTFARETARVVVHGGGVSVTEPIQGAPQTLEGISGQPTPDTTDESSLYTRFYRVDPNTLMQGLDEMLGQRPEAPAAKQTPAFAPREGALSPSKDLITPTNAAAAPVRFDKLKQILAAMGVGLEPPKAFFYNDRLGTLMVRATRADLDTIETVVQLLNTSPPQVLIDVKFAEVREDKDGAGDFLETLGIEFTASKPAPVTTGLPRNETNLHRAEFTGILTPAQFRVVLRALEQRNGVDLLSAPRVTTLSGRQAQIKVVDVRYVVTDLQDAKEKGDAPRPISEPIEFGPVLDVVPYVLANGATIQLTVIPTVREFLGYDVENATLFQTDASTNSPYPLPKFRVRQVVAGASLRDGQTLVLGAGTVEDVEKAGQDPSAATKRVRKSLFIFITPTIIDPAGNPVHAPEEMPSGDRRVPAQDRPG